MPFRGTCRLRCISTQRVANCLFPVYFHFHKLLLIPLVFKKNPTTCQYKVTPACFHTHAADVDEDSSRQPSDGVYRCAIELARRVRRMGPECRVCTISLSKQGVMRTTVKHHILSPLPDQPDQTSATIRTGVGLRWSLIRLSKRAFHSPGADGGNRNCPLHLTK